MRANWTPAMDAALRALRDQGFTWKAIGATLGVDQKAARRRALWLGIPTDRLNSGNFTGVEIVQGRRPLPCRFRWPYCATRLGKRWRLEAGTIGDGECKPER